MPEPLNKYIEQGHRVADTTPEVIPNTMTHFLEMTNDSQHRQDRLDHHPVIPGAFGTNLQLVGSSRLS